MPIVENPPLARSLYATIEVDETLKPKHYKAVGDRLRHAAEEQGEATAAAVIFLGPPASCRLFARGCLCRALCDSVSL